METRIDRILIIGSGKTGASTARTCLALAAREIIGTVSLFDERGREALDASLLALVGSGLQILSAEEFDEADAGGYDLCVVSPGISPFSELYRRSAELSREVISEPELAFRLCPDTWIAVTGTNGKTTTTALIAHLFACAGRNVHSVGNIGTPSIEAVGDELAHDGSHQGEGRAEGREAPVFVAELSSFQLAGTKRFHPRAAVLLNITPDHIDWHKTHEHYRDSKLKVFANMTADDVAIVCTDDPEVASATRALASKAGAPKVMEVSLSGDTSTDGGTIAGDERSLVVTLDGEQHRLGKAADLAIKGDHNIVNALSAACAALFSGIAPTIIERGLSTFEPIAHRLQLVATIDGVSYVNDSKATNTDATIKALSAFTDRPPILLLGGYDKHTDLTALIEVAVPACKHIIFFGAAGARFETEFLAHTKRTWPDISANAASFFRRTATLEDAVELASTLAQAGDAVVLSPACASFDEFTSFEDRGESFSAYVEDLRSKGARP